MPAKKAAAKKGKAAKRTKQGLSGGGTAKTFTKKECLDALNRAGGSYTRAAKLLGVNRSTVWRAVNQTWPDLVEDRDAAIQTVTAIAEDNVVEGVIDGDMQASMNWLRYQGGWNTKLEHSGPDGQPLVPSDTELARRMAFLLSKGANVG